MKAVYKFDVPIGFKPKDCNHCNLWHQYSMGVGGCSIAPYLNTPYGEKHRCPLIIEVEEDDYVYCTHCKHLNFDNDDTPNCIYEDKCDIDDCEDSMSMLYDRPHYEPRN